MIKHEHQKHYIILVKLNSLIRSTRKNIDKEIKVKLSYTCKAAIKCIEHTFKVLTLFFSAAKKIAVLSWMSFTCKSAPSCNSFDTTSVCPSDAATNKGV